MPIVIGNRKDVVRTLTGHTISFADAGEEKFVPNLPALLKECTDRGHVIKSESKPTVKVEPKAEDPAVEDKPVKKGPFGRPLKE